MAPTSFDASTLRDLGGAAARRPLRGVESSARAGPARADHPPPRCDLGLVQRDALQCVRAMKAPESLAGLQQILVGGEPLSA